MANILLVHEHPIIRHMVRGYLERGGHTVTTATTARAALEQVADHIDVVVSDIEVPGMGGMGLIDGLRKRELFAPVVLMSERFPHAEEAAAAAFVLLKPFTPEQLLNALGAALGDLSTMSEAVAG